MEALRSLDAVAVPLPRANIDTDQVVPALYLQKPRSANFGEFLFQAVRRDAHGRLRPDFPLNQPAYAGARILVAGSNFGCGSSREHAVWALYDAGFRAVVAPSFGDIFHGNALKNGLLPVQLPEDVVTGLLQELAGKPGTHLGIDLVAQTVCAPGGQVHPFGIDAFPRHCLLNGLDEIDYTLAQLALIEQFEHQSSQTLSLKKA